MKPFTQWTDSDVAAFNRKASRASDDLQRNPMPMSEPVPLEIPLHNKIIEHCLSQRPRWPYIHANPSQKSTIAKGCHDFTIFLPSKSLLNDTGRVVCIEVKAKGGKLDPDQVIWKHEMASVGHTVYVIYSFQEFENLLLL